MSATPDTKLTTPRPPVYFLGIGGPNFIENKGHPAYHKLREIGRLLTTNVKPAAVIVISAHWQHSPTSVGINVAENPGLIYDFYGFPPHYYDIKYPYKGSKEVAEKVVGRLEGAGIEVDRVTRGLDHGVWVGFLAAFDPVENPLDVPIIQLSLFNTEEPDQHYRLGQALEGLRDENILIVGAGMAVHNLQHFRAARGSGTDKPYASSFEQAITEAIAREPQNRWVAMMALIERTDAREAHPELEHILPLYVAAGAAGGDVGERIWAFPEISLNWATYRFGDVRE